MAWFSLDGETKNPLERRWCEALGGGRGDRKVLRWKSDSTDVCDLGESYNSFEAQFSPLSRSSWEFICPDASLQGGNEIMYLGCNMKHAVYHTREDILRSSVTLKFSPHLPTAW